MDGEKFGMRRIYRKSWPFDNLFGSLRHELNAAERGTWNDLLDFAKLSRVCPGVIAANEKTPYTHEYLAGIFNIPLELLERTLAKLKETERISENGTGILILNWSKYQSEYDRQKPYREAAKGRDPDKFNQGQYSDAGKLSAKELKKHRGSIEKIHNELTKKGGPQ